MIDNDDGDDAATKDKMILLEVVNTSSSSWDRWMDRKVDIVVIIDEIRYSVALYCMRW